MKRIRGMALVILVAACSSDDDSSPGSELQAEGDTESQAVSECLASVVDEPEYDTTDGNTESRMMTWGAPCSVDSECVALLGEGAVCDFLAVTFELPGGYCTKPCELPDRDTTFVADDPACDPNGGVNCIGQLPLYQRCAMPCTDDAQCDREGYYCRRMPSLGAEGDPSYCLMPNCCVGECD